MDEGIELLKKQYEAVKKQRDDYKLLLAELLDRISSGAYNHFDIKSGEVTDDEGNTVDMFHGGLDAYIKGLHHSRYFHIARLLEAMKEYGIKLDEQPHKAELAVLLENWKLPEEIEKWKSHYQEDIKEIPEDARKEMIKSLATHLVIFSHEYDFSKNYPGADRGVYGDAFFSIVRQAMRVAGIPPTPEGIEAVLTEAYHLDKNNRSKKI